MYGYIGYDEEKRCFYLMRNEDDYLNWIKINEEALNPEDAKRIKESDDVLSCTISIELD